MVANYLLTGMILQVWPNNGTDKDLHPQKLTCPLKKDHFKRNVVFQASSLRGYEFWGK